MSIVVVVFCIPANFSHPPKANGEKKIKRETVTERIFADMHMKSIAIGIVNAIFFSGETGRMISDKSQNLKTW